MGEQRQRQRRKEKEKEKEREKRVEALVDPYFSRRKVTTSDWSTRRTCLVFLFPAFFHLSSLLCARMCVHVSRLVSAPRAKTPELPKYIHLENGRTRERERERATLLRIRTSLCSSSARDRNMERGEQNARESRIH